ncbi:MAG: hypothetical protein HKO62_11700 [Gammaproteobacteria bacterium]|nr:hypothetical protein [Gammaproteobacteria bacterium]NNM01408.1 hypothetical protein [Gammaproteobacteria bacterium]
MSKSNAAMALQAPLTANDKRYKLSSVEKIDSPDGGSGSWHRYVIDGGYAPVIGSRQGTRKQVERYAQQFATELNQRRRSGGPTTMIRSRKSASSSSS